MSKDWEASPEDPVMESIYRAALVPDEWPRAIQLVGDRLGASSGFLFSSHSQTDPRAVVHAHNHSDEMMEAFSSHWHQHDEWAKAAHRSGLMKRGVVVLGTDLVPAEDFRQTFFYNEFAKSHEIASMAGSVVFDDENPQGMPFTNLCWYRAPDQPEFDASAKEQIRRYLPHFQQALAIQRRLQFLTIKAGSNALAALNVASYLLDAKAVIIQCNAVGENFLRTLPARSLQQRELRIIGNKCFPTVPEAIRMSHTGPVHIACLVEGDRPKVLSATLISLPPDVVTHAGEFEDRRFLLVMAIPAGNEYEVASAAGKLFGLTPAEVGVLAQLLEGNSAAEAAARLGISLATVRSHIKNLLQKAQVRSQAELLRMLRNMRY